MHVPPTYLAMPSCEPVPTEAFITSKCVLTTNSVIDAWVVEALVNICDMIKKCLYLPTQDGI